MSRFKRQLAAAAAVYEAECDCCDREPREQAPPVECEPYADAERERDGIEPRVDIARSLAESRRLDRVLGAGWDEGLPF